VTDDGEDVCRQWRRAATAKDAAAGGDGNRLLKGAEGGAARDDPEGYNGTGCRWWQSEISMELQVEHKAILICAAACGSGSSSTELCRWCSGDSCRWCSRLHLVELQVVWQRDFSGAADGAAMISAILICAAACGSGSSGTEHCRWCSGDSCRCGSRDPQ
jgi:hypothetical protein